MLLYCLRYIILIILLSVASIMDIKTKNIQNRLVLYGLVTGLIIAALNFSMPTVFDAFMGLIAGGGILLAIACFSKDGIGMGDVKLMACTGLYLGLGRTLGCLALSIIFCGIFGAVLLFLRGYNRKTTIPFAPFILIGSITVFIQGL